MPLMTEEYSNAGMPECTLKVTPSRLIVTVSSSAELLINGGWLYADFVRNAIQAWTMHSLAARSLLSQLLSPRTQFCSGFTFTCWHRQTLGYFCLLAECFHTCTQSAWLARELERKVEKCSLKKKKLILTWEVACWAFTNKVLFPSSLWRLFADSAFSIYIPFPPPP